MTRARFPVRIGTEVPTGPNGPSALLIVASRNNYRRWRAICLDIPYGVQTTEIGRSCP